MKINSYRLKKKNIYELTLDDGKTIELYEDTILKHELLLKREIKSNELDKILQDNSFIEGYFVALKYLTSKLRTEKEIRRRLNKYSADIQDYVVNRLRKEGYLNDTLYIKAFINDAVNLRFIGPNKIIYELKKMGFDINEIDEYLNTFEGSIWLSKINKYIAKKIKSNNRLPGIILKRKIYQDLISKGFYKEDILDSINSFEFVDDETIYQKEYDKLKIKLSKKFSGNELDFQIKMKLKQKGFNNYY